MPDPQRDHVQFEAGGELFAVRLADVREVVVPGIMSRIPKAPDCALGVVNHHGRIYTVLDAGRITGGGGTRAPALVVILDVKGRRVAVGADKVEGIGPLEVEDGLARLGERAVTVLDASQLMSEVDQVFGDEAGEVLAPAPNAVLGSSADPVSGPLSTEES